MVKLQTAGRDANSVFYSGVSYIPIGVGQVFTIQNQTVEHQLIAIEVIHHSEVHGNYTCEFTAIPADVCAPHYTDVEAFAKAESQPATIRDNNDPEGMGRVKVNFFWVSGSTSSEWMRMVQPYGGAGRGFYFRPEIGDEVMVHFEGGNADCPYVAATHYNGKEKPEFFDPKNMIKGWKLKFGQLFKFIEKTGIWLSDPSGNELHMDTENKNINLTSSGTITIKAKNIIFEASESITATAGENISNSADKDIIQTAGHDINQSATGNLTESANNKTEIIEKKHIRDSIESTQHAEKVTVFSTKENMHLESTNKTVNINSAEKSNMF
ncbi:hypothetical protein FNW52_18090 [Flavobacterium sp. ZT3R18]|uniref:phage baseplate assembly protein V n=1 Tax=Flavobacterium sp. ZT3R18 TaxID=2594429 RepID=UPI00117AE045|nr:phage baseplate assembly protein V [Flavobacterium sp. ZT3R18]TRX31903.1 hypothetical protein FNW52_18090 [Flavobacterium sp. ZT3R18]